MDDITFSASISSLQHLAALKFASNLINGNFLCIFDELILKASTSEKTFYFTEGQENWILTQNIARSCKSLPNLLIKPLAYILYPIIAEIYYWIRDHFKIIKHIERRYCAHMLYWNAEGKIDRTKTAYLLIQNESIDISTRFVMACIYFIEYDIMLLWQMMSALEKEKVPLIDYNPSVRFWVKLLQKNVESPWTDYLDDPDVFTHLEERYNHETSDFYSIRLSSFFDEMSECCRYHSLLHLWPYYIHMDDLRFCLRHMPSHVLSKQPMLTEGLNCYMHWAFKWVFDCLAEQEWEHLTLIGLEVVVHDIICTKILQDTHNFDYLHLLQFLWNMIPDIKKEYIEKRGFFPLIHGVLNYDDNTPPLSLKEILQDCTPELMSQYCTPELLFPLDVEELRASFIRLTPVYEKVDELINNMMWKV